MNSSSKRFYGPSEGWSKDDIAVYLYDEQFTDSDVCLASFEEILSLITDEDAQKFANDTSLIDYDSEEERVMEWARIANILFKKLLTKLKPS